MLQLDYSTSCVCYTVSSNESERLLVFRYYFVNNSETGLYGVCIEKLEDAVKTDSAQALDLSNNLSVINNLIYKLQTHSVTPAHLDAVLEDGLLQLC